ncbi:hypothetical protein LCGC14_2519150 [marine sediment metagenome]|uniref:Uncharacterized protein n=1 Tax=marine sediment metagenome TaxID=412755 RepID=A0A0F9DQ74_9ZZZZ
MGWILGLIFIVFLAAILFAHNWEKRRFNSGNCPGCEKPWRLFDVDSQGGRGYTCRACNKGTWVSYWGIDHQ